MERDQITRRQQATRLLGGLAIAVAAASCSLRERLPEPPAIGWEFGAIPLTSCARVQAPVVSVAELRDADLADSTLVITKFEFGHVNASSAIDELRREIGPRKDLSTRVSTNSNDAILLGRVELLRWVCEYLRHRDRCASTDDCDR